MGLLKSKHIYYRTTKTLNSGWNQAWASQLEKQESLEQMPLGHIIYIVVLDRATIWCQVAVFVQGLENGPEF